jgi:predicted RNA-binding protein with PIN domain
MVVTLSVDGYNDITQWAQNQKEARKACAIKFAKECL